METNKINNNIAALLNELADYIRRNTPVRFGQLCLKMHVAPSTMYGYVRLLLDMYTDITYSRGVFYAPMHHRMPDGKEVPPER